MNMYISALGFASLALLLAACGGKDQPALGAHSSSTSGCTTAPACGSCGTCFERCFCEQGDSSACANQCASPASTATSTSTAPMPTTAPTTSPTTVPTTAPTSMPPEGTQTLT